MTVMPEFPLSLHWRWHRAPAAEDPATFLAQQPLTAVKHNLQRTVYTGEAVGGVHVKWLRANTPRAKLRDWLRGPKAKLEFEKLQALRALNIPCPVPLAWGVAVGPEGRSTALITRTVLDAIPLEAVLLGPLSPQRRRGLARGLGAYFARLHAAGVMHPDPHPGNILMCEGDFVLLDAHAVAFHAPGQREANLVLWNRWFQLRSTATDRLRFWRAYQRGLPNDSLSLHAADIEAKTLRSNLRFWQRRLKRYTGMNRQCQPVDVGVWRGHRLADVPQGVVALLHHPEPAGIFNAGAPGELLKDSPSSCVMRLPGGLIAKLFRTKKRFAGSKSLFRRTAAVRTWLNGLSLLDRGLPTARPLLMIQRYRSGFAAEAIAVFQEIPDAMELQEYAAGASEEQLRRTAVAVGQLLRTMHQRGVSQRDLKASNILVCPETAGLFLIDLVGVTLHGHSVRDAIRKRDLARLSASFTGGTLRRAHKLRFLRSYLGPTQASHWAEWWVWLRRATEAKQRKNAQNQRALH